MAPIRCTALLFLCALITGCTAEGTAAMKSDEAGSLYAQTPAAQATLQESLFKEDTAAISNDDIARILAAKLEIPKNSKLAVVRFGQLPYWWGWSEDFVRTNQQIDDDFLGALKQANRVKEVAYLPSLVTPRDMTLPHLRQAAARLQADLLLIYRTSTQSYQRNKIFSDDETRAYCTVEAVLLDTRTGIIPFSTVVTEQFSAKKNKQDYDFQETIAKANQQAIAKAWLHLAQNTKAYLASL